LNTYTFHINLYDLVFLGAIFIGIVFALQLGFAKKTGRTANRFLGLALVTMALWLIWVLGRDIRLAAYFPHWSWLPLRFSLALGPLLYFYVRQMTRPEQVFRWKDLLHFSPLLLEQGVLLLEAMQSMRKGAATYGTLIFQQMSTLLHLAAFISVIIYLCWSFRLIERFYRQLKFNEVSDRYRYELRWLKRSLRGFGILWLLWIPYTALDYYNHLSIRTYYPLYLLLAVVLIWIAVRAFFRPEAVVPSQIPSDSKPLASATLKQKGTWLKKAVKANLYYQDPELNLNSLAEKLDLTTHELSRIINMVLKKNFSDFINDYRVAEVARKMLDPAYDHITLLGIAFESGFNSKSTFNRAFRQMTGKSAAEYKKERPFYNLRRYPRFAAVNSSQEAIQIWPSRKLNRNFMFRNYLKIAWRHLTRRKLYSAINIIGLATGMAACIVILVFVFYENSFDSMHHNNIYRLNDVETFTSTATSQKTAITMFPMGPTLKDEFPEVLNYSRVDGKSQYEMTYGEKRVFFPQAFFVDTSFLRMFDFPLLEGDRQTVLKNPNSIVLTESAARKLFGAADPIGKTVSHFGEDTLVYTVTGILKDVPANSQFQFDALQSFNTIYKPKWMDRWSDHWVNTYVELAPHTDVAALEKKFPVYLKKHHVSGKDIHYGLFLLPLRDVHAGAVDIIYDDINFQKFDKRYTNIFMGIGLLVLLIACINFMNLSTAQSAERSKEVGIRKTIGALRSQLGLQFLGEAVLLSLIALAIALGLVSLALPYINRLSGRDLSAILFAHPGLLVALFLGTIVLGVISGLYPAIYLSSFQPAKVLKGVGELGGKKSTFRNVLVVGQFASAIFLTVATIFVFRQLNYMEKRDPGFDHDQVVTIRLHGITSGKYALLKEELSAGLLVVGVTGAQDQLGSDVGQLGFGFWPGNGPMRVVITPGLFVDHDYLSLYKIHLVAGRNFSSEKSALAKEFIINETLGRELLKDQPGMPLSSLIGKHFGGDTSSSIVGISRDFNFNSLHHKIEPMFLGDLNQPVGGGFSTMSVKINGRQASQAIAFIESTWKKVLPEYPFEYQFLDDHFKEIYRTDTQVSQMVAIMTGLAIFISCLGLYGLASFSTEKRAKEIGIRKVMGASVKDVVFLLSKHFIRLVLIGNLIAWPLAWLALHRWIQGYAYRVAFSCWVFVLAGMAALLIALVTVSFLTIKAATSNPVKSLRAE
jgi:putative ABC transport system permease protein